MELWMAHKFKPSKKVFAEIKYINYICRNLWCLKISKKSNTLQEKNKTPNEIHASFCFSDLSRLELLCFIQIDNKWFQDISNTSLILPIWRIPPSKKTTTTQDSIRKSTFDFIFAQNNHWLRENSKNCVSKKKKRVEIPQNWYIEHMLYLYLILLYYGRVILCSSTVLLVLFIIIQT